MVAENPMLKPTKPVTGLGEPQSQPDVMGAIRQKRGGAPSRQMNSLEILRESMAEELADPAQMEKFLSDIARGAQAGAFGLVQIGNTVFLISKFSDGGQPLPAATAEVHMFSVEPTSSLGARIAVLPNTMRELGYRKLFTILDDASMVRLLQSVAPKAKMAVNVQQSNMGGQPVYRAEIDLL